MVGNLLTKTIDGIDTSYAYNDNDQLTTQGSVTFTYDDNGNLVAKDDIIYEYDDKNRLIKTTTPNNTIEYSYDANDNRVAKTTNQGTTTYLIDANTAYAQVITESKEDGTEVNYTYGNDLLSDGTRHFLTDALGSTRGLVDGSEALTDSYAYTPYGELANHDGNATNGFLFTGEQFDSETDEYYLRARYYDPSTSRFSSRDTYDGTAGNPITLNHYLYTGSNPILYTDPSGHFFGGFASMSISMMSTIGAGYPRIAGTVAQGTIASMYARVIVLGMHMRNEALDDIMTSIMVGGMSQQTIQDAYDKYTYATQYMSMVTGTALKTYRATSWMQATTGFAQGLIKMPLAQYSSVPSAYLAKTNSLNHLVITRLDNVVKDTIKFEKAIDILKDMTSLIRKIYDKGTH